MVYVKDSPPVGATKTEREAYLERELDKLRIDSGQVNELLEALVGALQSGGVWTLFLWDDSQVIDDPGTGNMRGNSNLLPNVTEFAVSATTLTDTQPPYQTLDQGDRIVVVNQSADVQEIYELDETPIFNATWWQFNVTHLSGQNNNPTTGDIMTLIWFPVAEIAEDFRL